MKTLPTPLRVEEALQHDGIDISVPAGGALTIGPFREGYSRSFRLIHVESIRDLQRLELLPREIDEKELTSAFYADAKTYREATLKQQLAGLPRRAPTCSCEGHADDAGESLRRLHVQNRMIDLLQPLSRRALTAGDLLVLETYGQLRRWFNRPAPYLIGAVVLNDISIGDRATLTLTPTVIYLRANQITMGSNSNMSFASGSVHVNCQVLNGYDPFMSTTVTVKPKQFVFGLSREKEVGT